MAADRKQPDRSDVPTEEQLKRVESFMRGKLDAREGEEVLRLMTEHPAVVEAYVASRDRARPDRERALSTQEELLIADFLEGVLHGAERESALRLLAEKPEAYEVWVESAPALREPWVSESPAEVAAASSGDEAGAPTRVVPPPPPPPSLWRRLLDRLAGVLERPWTRLAVPAAAVAVLALLLVRPGLDPAGAGLVQIADVLGTSTLSAGLAADHPLGASRGGPSVAASELGRAFQLGVRVMDAEGALRLGRTQEARVTLATVVALLEDAGAPPPVLVPVQRFADASEPRERAQADDNIETWLGDTGLGPLARYRLGKGSEAVRFALVAGDAEEARAAVGRGSLDVGADAQLAPAARDSLDALRGLLSFRDGSAFDGARMLVLLSTVMDQAAR